MRPIYIELITIILTMIATGVVLWGSARKALSRLNAGLDGVQAQVDADVPRNEFNQLKGELEQMIGELRSEVSEPQGGMRARFGKPPVQTPETPEG